jgi:hypothetical protein
VPQAEVPAEIPHGGPHEKEHKKMLSSRRRLLGLLLVLAIAAGGLAFTKMAAWWVVVPPTVMLFGYLTLLYEAGKADAERRELARARAAAEAAAEVAAAKRAAPSAPAAPPAPDAEVIDISASLTVAGHKFYDQYADTKLRAVGDLTIPLRRRLRPCQVARSGRPAGQVTRECSCGYRGSCCVPALGVPLLIRRGCLTHVVRTT